MNLLKTELPEIIERCRQENQILVTGPQRSGTTIGAHILAAETSLPYIDEEEVPTVASLFDLIGKNKNFVVQAPRWCAYLHLFPIPIVVMCRNVDDIKCSQKRIGWQHEKEELTRYFKNEGEIARIKYEMLEKYQLSGNIAPWIMGLEYESLKDHRLWHNKRERFGPRQWR